jgi:hypothetical protein
MLQIQRLGGGRKIHNILNEVKHWWSEIQNFETALIVRRYRGFTILSLIYQSQKINYREVFKEWRQTLHNGHLQLQSSVGSQGHCAI